MKRSIVICLSSFVLLQSLSAQNSPAPPSAPATPAPAASASVSPSEDFADRIQQHIERKFSKHLDAALDRDSERKHSAEDIPAMVIPLVGIIFITAFGAPVLIVAAILFFASSRNRMMHKTVRMMVEKGQPVPAALLAPPVQAARQRSDLRRGVVLTMLGAGVMVFLGAATEWEGGAWALGLIPTLIGAGYFLVWKLEGTQKPGPDNPPPLP
jgi:hypothetical protein